ncbi:MAG: hypothetical protein ACF8R7_04870 [Phycisphaerales bacterium JB039]
MIPGARFISTLLTLCCVLALALPLGGAAPEPNPAPQRWELQIRPGPLRVASVETEGGARLYLYFTYTVTNKSGQSVLFAPMFTLATDEGGSQVAGDGVPGEVTSELLGRLENPFLEDQLSIIGPLQQGIENAREGLVIWPLLDADVDELKLFAAGFSGETARVEIIDPVDEQARTVTLRKTLMLRYATPGELQPGPQPLQMTDQRWIMR